MTKSVEEMKQELEGLENNQKPAAALPAPKKLTDEEQTAMIRRIFNEMLADIKPSPPEPKAEPQVQDSKPTPEPEPARRELTSEDRERAKRLFWERQLQRVERG